MREIRLTLVPVDTPDIKGEYDILVNELTKYNPEMLDKERLLVISKIDMLDDELRAELKQSSMFHSRGSLYVYFLSSSNRADEQSERRFGKC
jgi:GTP-binding protein